MKHAYVYMWINLLWEPITWLAVKTKPRAAGLELPHVVFVRTMRITARSHFLTNVIFIQLQMTNNYSKVNIVAILLAVHVSAQIT